jgi:deoxyribodipyrimidine photo-lyase
VLARTKPAIWWIRRDIRLRDNAALQHCWAAGRRIVPLFILDPAILNSTSHRHAANRKAFLLESLRSLDVDLRARGNGLVVRSGCPELVLRSVMAECGAEEIFAITDFSPYARRRDNKIGKLLPLHLLPGVPVHMPGAVLKADGRPYTVFTPFSRTWKSLPLPPCVEVSAGRLAGVSGIATEPLPMLTGSAHFPASESEARRRLDGFLDGPIKSYFDDRNRLDLRGTSELSPYFRFGLISAAEAARRAGLVAESPSSDASGSAGARTWLNELIWRDFYISVLSGFPGVLKDEFQPRFRRVRWRVDRTGLERWRHGQTGYPIVDAGMRQLIASGWIHNRARMIVASFLVKDLFVDWREGERWFMQHLIDGDPAANNGGWQWVAGVGTDAAPYFRVFNPVTQGERVDPQGEYVRRWVPELAQIPPKYVHRPWDAPTDVLRRAGVRLGKSYPRPMVDHAAARMRALAIFSRAKR